MSKWLVGEKCFSLRYGEGAIAKYEEGSIYSVTTMHVFKWKERSRVFEAEWTEEGREYEFDCCPTLFLSREEVKEWVMRIGNI